jgi:hypothetical protein
MQSLTKVSSEYPPSFIMVTPRAKFAFTLVMVSTAVATLIVSRGLPLHSGHFSQPLPISSRPAYSGTECIPGSPPVVLFGGQEQQVLRAQAVTGWRILVNRKLGFSVQYPPSWYARSFDRSGDLDISNVPFADYGHGGYLPAGGAEIQFGAIDKLDAPAILAVQQKLDCFHNQIQNVVLSNGTRAYEFEEPSDAYEPGVPPNSAITYYIFTKTTVFGIHMDYRAVSDAPTLLRILDKFIASLASPLP